MDEIDIDIDEDDDCDTGNKMEEEK